MNLTELLLIVLFFILYTPNLVFKPFVKNKWYNIFICSLLFGISIYLVNLFLYKYLHIEERFVEGASANSPGNLGQTDECNKSTQYYKDILNNVKAPTAGVNPNQYVPIVDSINKNAQNISKDICQPKSKFTLAPENVPNSSLSSSQQKYVIAAQKNLNEQLAPFVKENQENAAKVKAAAEKALKDAQEKSAKLLKESQEKAAQSLKSTKK